MNVKPKNTSFHIMGTEKQFVVDFISTMFDQPYSWEFDLIPYYSNNKVDLTISNLGKFSKLYQGLGLADNSNRDKFIADKTFRLSEDIEIVLPEKSAENIIDDSWELADIRF